MKKTILTYILFLILANVYSQEEFNFLKTVPKDTIKLHINDIERLNQSYTTIRSAGVSDEFYTIKKTKKKLNGFYKVNVNETDFFTGYFEEGEKYLKKNGNILNSNIFRYYNAENNITKIEIYDPIEVSNSFYLSVDNYNINSKKLKIKSINRSEIKSGVLIQKKCNDFFIWKLKFKSDPKSKIKIPSKILIKQKL